IHIETNSDVWMRHFLDGRKRLGCRVEGHARLPVTGGAERFHYERDAMFGGNIAGLLEPADDLRALLFPSDIRLHSAHEDDGHSPTELHRHFGSRRHLVE